MTRRSHLLTSLCLALALAGCAGNPASLKLTRRGAIAKANSSAPAHLAPLPSADRSFVATDGTGTVSGTVAFRQIANDFFDNNAANYHLASMASANAIVTLSTPEEAQYTKNGEVISGMSGTDGAFSLAGAPGSAYVVNANLVGGHRLSKLVLPGSSGFAVNEATTAVTEMLRWQVRPAPATSTDSTYNGVLTGRFTLEDLTATQVAALEDQTASTLPQLGFETSGQTIASLKVGAGHVLRNQYVEAFGSRASATGNTVYDTLSDLWANILGFRPLAISRVAGNGLRTFDQGENKLATEAGLVAPIDCVADAQGNLYITEQDLHTIRFIPKTGASAGHISIKAGYVGSPTSLSDFEAVYGGPEFDSPYDASAAPAIGTDTPLYAPYRLIVEESGTPGSPNLYFSSKFGERVFFIPGVDYTGGSKFGRDFLADHLYTLVGWGKGEGSEVDYYGGVGGPGDGGYGSDTLLNEPTGIALDSAGNLWIMDSGLMNLETTANDPFAVIPSATASEQGFHGTVRVLRNDNAVFDLRFTLNGQPKAFDGAQDLRYYKDGSNAEWLFIADTEDHAVYKVPLPDASTFAGLDGSAPDATELAKRTIALDDYLLLGKPGTAGFIDTAGGALYPDIYDVSAGFPASQALLNRPTSVVILADDEVLVADSGNKRIRLLKGGKVYTVAGGLDTQYLTGDARLSLLPATSYLNREVLTDTTDPEHGSLLLTDPKEAIVRRIWAGRGLF